MLKLFLNLLISILIYHEVENLNRDTHQVTVHINCEENCFPATAHPNHKQKTYFSATCKGKCDQISGAKYEWTFCQNDKPRTDPVQKLAGNGTKCMIHENVLEPDVSYCLEVNLKQESHILATNRIFFSFDKLPKAHQAVMKRDIPSFLEPLSNPIADIIGQFEVSDEDIRKAKNVTELCKIMIKKYAETIKETDFALNSENEFNRVQNIFTKCMTDNAHDNFDVLNPVDRTIKIPVHLDPGENDYEVIDRINKITKNLSVLTNDILEATHVAAKSLLKIIQIGEHHIGQKNLTIFVAKDVGKQIAGTKVTLPKFALVASMDFAKTDRVFDLLIAIWPKDIFWWNSANIKVVTEIVSVQFWHNALNKRVRNFKAPASILIDTKESIDFSPIIYNSNVSVPKNYSVIAEGDLTQMTRVHRMEIPARSVLHIEFHNITDTFDIVLTKLEYPTLRNFKSDNITINSTTNNYFRIINSEKKDIWGYFAVLPNKMANPNSSILYFNMSLVLSFCVQWDKDTEAWIPDCRPGLASTMKVFHCECNHFSIFAGYFQNSHSVVQKLNSFRVFLALQPFYIVFLTLAFTLFVYVFALMLLLLKKHPEVYFLADNVKDDLYAYLIVIRTEDIRDAGTTSKIGIQVFGSKSSSEPHVLNYPDPKMRLLQKCGEDHFVMTTKQYLGEIEKIDLWFDCTGSSPTWHCRDIVVHDMQGDQYWYFKIRINFSVTDGVSFASVVPTDYEKVPPVQCKCCNYLHMMYFFGKDLKQFTFTARSTVILSNILTIYSLMLLLGDLLELRIRDRFDPHGIYYIPGLVVGRAFLSAAISFGIHQIITYMFRFTDIEVSICNRTFRKAYRLSLTCWMILLTIILSCIGFLLTFGFWLPRHSGEIWATWSMFAVVFEQVVIENFWIIVQTFLCRLRLIVRLQKNLGPFVKSIELQREYLMKKFGSELLRPYLAHLYSPMNAIQEAKRSINVKLRDSIYNDLEDLILYGLYNILLFLVILGYKDPLTIPAKNNVHAMIDGKHTRTLGATELESIYDAYTYINETQIPIMHPEIWYANYTITTRNFMVDNCNKYIGVARLRQQRVSDFCSIPKIMHFMNMSCSPEFSRSVALYDDFGPKWSSATANKNLNNSNKFEYQTVGQTDNLLNFGVIATYSGGGYVAHLARSVSTSYTKLKNLVNNFWLDTKTRALYFEYLIYNANSNLFMAVNVQIEYTATGYMSNVIEVQVVRMLVGQSSADIGRTILSVLYLLVIFSLMVKVVKGVWKNRKFYKDPWLFIDFIVNIASLLNILVFFLRGEELEKYITNVEQSKYESFVSFSSMIAMEEFLVMMSGILICVATIRLWRFLRFATFFRIMERTLSMAGFPLLAVTFSFAVMLIAFGFSGILIYGNEYPELSSFIKIVATLICLSLKPDQFDLTVYLDLQISYYYFALYLIMMQVILLVYITVIIMAYVKAQLELSVAPDSYTVVSWAKERSVYVPLLVRTKFIRFRGGSKKIKNPVTPKADEFRYAGCIGVPTSVMNSMKFIVSCVMRNMNQTEIEQEVLTAHEIQMMLGVCTNFVFKDYERDEMELFFKGHFAGKRIKLVDEKRINMVADFMKVVFEKKEVEERESDLFKVNFLKMVNRKNRILRECKLKLMVIRKTISDIEEKVNTVEFF